MDRKSGALYTTNTSWTPIIVGAVYSIRCRIFYYRKPSVEQISTIAGMIGVTVISGLAVNFVKISTKLQYVAQVSETEEKIISLQEMLDAMLPNMLAVLYTGLMFYLIKKKKWSTYKLVIFTIIVGILLSVIGILG